MTVLPLSAWTHHACKQDTRIGDTVTSNNAESVFNMIGEEVRLLLKTPFGVSANIGTWFGLLAWVTWGKDR